MLISLGYHITPQVLIHGGLSYTANETGFDSVIYESIPAEVITKMVDTNKYDYDHSNISDLSDLKINTFGLNFGAAFEVNEFFGITADFDYEKWDDEEWYLVDGTGDFYMGTFGFLFTF